MEKLFYTFVAVFCLATVDVQAQEERKIDIQVGEQLPEFTLPMLNSEYTKIQGEIKPENMKGKVVFITFWSYWCVGCLLELHDIQETGFYDDYKQEKDFLFLCINREDTITKIAETCKKHNFTLPMGTDFSKSIYKKFWVTGLPIAIIADKKGKIIYAESGYGSHQLPKYREMIDKALGRKPSTKQPAKKEDNNRKS